jgi:Protein of unknown function (DUF3179)
MVGAAGLGLLGRKATRWTIAAAILAEAIAVASVVGYERRSRRAEERGMTFSHNPNSWWVDNPARPTNNPPVLAGTLAKIKPTDWVIGVEIAGRQRAYRVDAFDDPSGHLVNDMIGGIPVSVAYSNITRTARVYTDRKESSLLDAEIIGLLNTHEMVIRLRGHLYSHLSGRPVEPEKAPPAMPYELLTPAVMTWQEWLARHPETDVFIGGR